MTDKQFVKSIYPTAHLFKFTVSFRPERAKNYLVFLPRETFWSNQGNTPKEAWSNTAQLIRNNMVRKLEK
jgi:hypothetical protein